MSTLYYLNHQHVQWCLKAFSFLRIFDAFKYFGNQFIELISCENISTSISQINWNHHNRMTRKLFSCANALLCLIQIHQSIFNSRFRWLFRVSFNFKHLYSCVTRIRVRIILKFKTVGFFSSQAKKKPQKQQSNMSFGDKMK